MATKKTSATRRTVASLAIAAAVAVAAYYAHTAWQTRRGEAALAATQLQFLPLDAALASAKADGKPVLVDFSAIWCPVCRRLHAEVFTDPAVKATITASYVLARVDYEAPEAPAFMQRYGVQGFPTLLVLDAEGKLLRQVPVRFEPQQFLAGLGSR